MDKQYYIYIMTNFTNTTLYIGVTNDLVRRVYEHKHKVIKGFTAKYNLDKLVYFEVFQNSENAIKREKNLLIEDVNPSWSDLYNVILETEG